MGGPEAFAAGRGEQLVHPEGGFADGLGGVALRAGQREDGDIGALDLRIPAVGAVRPPGDGLEVEEVAERLERVLAGQAFGPAAVADDAEGVRGQHV